MKLIQYIPFVLMLSACQLFKETGNGISKPVPKHFEIALDSSTIQGDLPAWKEFILDTFLVALIEEGLVNNLDMITASQRINQARAAFTYSKRAFIPSFDIMGGAGITRFGKYTLDGVGNFDTNKSPNITSDMRIPNPVPDYLTGMSMSWEVGLAGQLRHRKAAAAQGFYGSQKDMHLVQTHLVTAISKLYYELLGIDNELDIILKNLQLQEQAMDIVDIQKESGQINELAVKQFYVQLLQTRSILSVKRQEQMAIQFALNSLIGRYPVEIERMDTLEMSGQFALIKTGLPAQMIIRRPDIQMAEANLKASEAQLMAMRAAFFPSINLTGLLAFNGFNAAFFLNPVSIAYFGGAMVTAPLINRNRHRYTFRYQQAEKQIAFSQYQQAVINSIAEVNNQYERVRTYDEVVSIKQEEVAELIAATSIASDLFNTGYASYLEVLLVRTNVLQAEIALVEAKKQFYFAYLDLYKALGGGWE